MGAWSRAASELTAVALRPTARQSCSGGGAGRRRGCSVTLDRRPRLSRSGPASRARVLVRERAGSVLPAPARSPPRADHRPAIILFASTPNSESRARRRFRVLLRRPQTGGGAPPSLTAANDSAPHAATLPSSAAALRATFCHPLSGWVGRASLAIDLLFRNFAAAARVHLLLLGSTAPRHCRARAARRVRVSSPVRAPHACSLTRRGAPPGSSGGLMANFGLQG